MRPGLIIENEPTAPVELLGDWLEARRIAAAMFSMLDSGFEELPDPEEHDFVIVLGSSHSANQTEPAWIPGLRAYMRRTAEREVPLLGICFGAQMLSQVLGGSVARMPQPEIFWGDVELADAPIPEGPWLVWHYDAFTVPPGAIELARTERAPLAFRRGPHLGVQFHP